MYIGVPTVADDLAYLSKFKDELQLRGCQLSKTNTCIIFTCIKKNDNFSKETGHS